MKLILVGYTAAKTRSAQAFCARALRKLPVDRRVLVLNRPELRASIEAEGWDVLDGDNAFGEFSGWQQGLEHLQAGGASDAIVFVNDTVVSHRRYSRFRQWAFLREAWSAGPRSIVGYTDHADNSLGDLSIDAMVLPGWVSSYCFMLGDETLRRLGWRLWDAASLDRCVRGGTDEARFFSDAVSPDLQRHLRRWLFEGGWYRSERLTRATEAMLTRKARAICAELLLSARCWALGCDRRDPFERHPWARALDRRSEPWARRLGARRDWARHPDNWARGAVSPADQIGVETGAAGSGTPPGPA
jgi:hypothetical protein